MARNKPPRDLLKRRKEPIRKLKPAQKIKFSLDWKFWLGLLIGIVALWLAVEDRPTVSLGPRTDAGNLFSTQVIIVNNGVLPIHDVTFATFLKHIGTNQGVFDDNDASGYQLPTKTLRPGEPVTTTFEKIISPERNGDSFMILPGIQFKEVDIALIASFHPSWAPFWRRTRVFRFEAINSSEGISLRQVPAEDIEQEYRKSISGH